MAKSEDPDQMPQSAASDQGLHCLKGLLVQILRVITVCINSQFSMTNVMQK